MIITCNVCLSLKKGNRGAGDMNEPKRMGVELGKVSHARRKITQAKQLTFVDRL